MADPTQLPPLPVIPKPLRAQPHRTQTGGRPSKLHIPTLAQLDLNQPNREIQAQNLRLTAYQLASVMGRDIRIKLRSGVEKGMREMVWSCGVMMDKVLGGVESTGLVLHVPLQVVDKLILAVKSRAQDAQVIDNTQRATSDNIHYATLDTAQKDSIQTDRHDEAGG